MHSGSHGRNLRKGRVSETGRVYLITTVAEGRQLLFRDFAAARDIIAELRRCDAHGRCTTLAFVLMPDHLHWLLRLEDGDLSRVVGLFKAASARTINRRFGTPGRRVWQAGFHDHALRSEEDLAGLARYIIANPLRAGLARSVRDYPHWDAMWIGAPRQGHPQQERRKARLPFLFAAAAAPPSRE